jgi:protein-S-isoprenylcysteine O-methyltransferase Ste14
MLQLIALVEVIFCWIVWSLAFIKPSKQAAKQKQAAIAPASKWGIFLVMLGFACIWAYVRPMGFAKSTPSLIVSMLLGPPSVALVWAATRHLGKQWRYQAAVSEDHELIKTGPYAFLRHPIYTSLFGMLMATGAAWTWWPMWVAAAIFFIAGTEIRVRAEDRLLGERFQNEFSEYRSRVRAYIPFIR